jgi:hypothetical protein
MFASLGVTLLLAVWAEGKGPKDSPKAAETRKRLQEKISVDFSDTRLEDAMDELKDKVKGLGITYASGLSRNVLIKFKADDMTLEQVLDGMFKKNGLGYIVVSKVGTAYDGNLQIRQSKERGYPAGEEPPKTTVRKGKGKDKDMDDADTEKTAAKDKGKKKPMAKAKTEDKDSGDAKEKTEDDAEKAEQDADRKLKFAQDLADAGKTDKAKARLEDLIAKYPKTKAAEKARELLKNLDK